MLHKQHIFTEIKKCSLRKLLVKIITQIAYFFNSPCPLDILWWNMRFKAKKSGKISPIWDQTPTKVVEFVKIVIRSVIFQYFINSVLRVRYDNFVLKQNWDIRRDKPDIVFSPLTWHKIILFWFIIILPTFRKLFQKIS